jgi:outer membrane lipoprotein-sorting protein
MIKLLALWEQQSAKITTLDATFDRVDESKVWDDVTHYKGRALLKSPNLACLNLERVEPDGKKTAFQERIICTGKDVWQYDGASGRSPSTRSRRRSRSAPWRRVPCRSCSTCTPTP